MSSTTGFTPRTLPGTGIHTIARAPLSRLAEGVRRWWRITTTRRGLMDMDDRMLSDLGISRAQAQFELSRKPWSPFQ